jgi:hypothetical protein
MAGWLKKMLRGDATIREKFMAQIQRDFAFLFTEYAAKIISNDKEYPPMFDNALITVVVDGIRFRFVQDRGEQRVDVASLEAPEAWEELSFVLMVIDPIGEKPSWASLRDLAGILRMRLAQLEDAFSTAKYASTYKRLAERHAHERMKWAAESNSGE